MKYTEWKQQLVQEIALLEQGEQETILAYYDELFSDKSEQGFSEKQILKAFGDPKEVANELTAGLGTVGNSPQSEEDKESRKEKFKENFEKFQDKFNTKVNAMLASLGKSIKKFASYAKTKLDQLDQYHKSKNNDKNDD